VATPTPVAAPTFFNGATEAAVPAEVTPATPVLNQPLSVKAPGFLIREQNYAGAPIYLWPADEGYVSELVYDWEFTDGNFRLVRWASPFTVTLDGDLATNPSVLAKTQEVVAEMVRATGLPITVGPGGACVISLDSSILPDENAVGEARLRFRGASIIGADVVFASRGEITGGTSSEYRNTLLHEMGHVLGLAHSPNNRDVMTPGTGPGSKVANFSDSEATSLRMMYRYRTAGNFPPDRDPALGVRPSAFVQPIRTVFRD
jgi:hypothetical protein